MYAPKGKRDGFGKPSRFFATVELQGWILTSGTGTAIS